MDPLRECGMGAWKEDIMICIKALFIPTLFHVINSKSFTSSQQIILIPSISILS